MRWDKERLVEEVELLKAQNQDLQHIKEIVDNNLEESLKNLAHEREVRYHILRPPMCLVLCFTFL